MLSRYFTVAGSILIEMFNFGQEQYGKWLRWSKSSVRDITYVNCLFDKGIIEHYRAPMSHLCQWTVLAVNNRPTLSQRTNQQKRQFAVQEP